jgi:predicted PurR-regulated permease PerM
MPEEKSSVRITLTTASLIRIILVILGLYFAFLIKDILIILFVAVVLASAFDPWVGWMKKHGLPRSLGIALIYIAMILVIGVTAYLVVPLIVSQFSQLLNDLPSYLDQFNKFLASFRSFTSSYGWLDNIRTSLINFGSNFQGAANGVFSTLFNIVGGIFSLVIVLVITFYMVVEHNSIRKLIWSLTPENKQTHVMEIFNQMEKKIGLWFRGQLILCLAVFALTYAGLLILGVKYALILALVSGLAEFIPYLGPFLGGIPAVFLSLSQAPTLAIFVAILYIIVHEIESNLLVPKIMQKALGMNPIVTIVVLMIGFSLGGIMGALLSIPAGTAALVVFDDMLHKKKIKSEELI